MRRSDGSRTRTCPGSSVACCAEAGGARVAARIAAAADDTEPGRLLFSRLRPRSRCCGGLRKKRGVLARADIPRRARRWRTPTLRRSGVSPLSSRRPCANCRSSAEERSDLRQRRHLSDLQRAQKHRAVDEAQRKGAGLLAFQHRFLAERVDAGGDADSGVLLDGLAEAGNRAVERVEQIGHVLGLHAGREPIERRLRPPSSGIFSRPSAGMTFSMPATVICSSPSRRPFAVRPRVPAATTTSSPCCDARLHDFDLAAGGRGVRETVRARVLARNPAAGQLRADVGIEGRGQQRMYFPARCRPRSSARYRSGSVRQRSLGKAAMQFDVFGVRERRLRGPVMRSIVGSSNTMEARCGKAGRPTTLERAVRQFPTAKVPAAIRDRGGSGEFRDQQFRIVVCATTDFAEAGGDRRLRRGLARGLRVSETLAPSQRTSRRKGKPATDRFAQS